MPVTSPRSLLTLLLGSLLAVGLCAPLPGCSPSGMPMTQPPDPNENPPPPPKGGQYGSGSGSGSGMQPPPVCPVTQRQCPTVFAYAGSMALPLTGKESAVELHGDFDSWGKGQVMTYDMPSSSWKTTIELPLGGEVTYKFHITYSDGTAEQWVPDPTNPNMLDDGFGGKNSQLMGLTCVKYDCAPVPTQCRVAAPKGYDWRDAVIYFVFVDRFLNGDTSNDTPVTAGVDPIANFQGGDWAGVTQRINDGYFTSLGVNTLWLTVPMDNTDLKGQGTDGRQYSAYHGYWPRDLDRPEFHFGTLATLKALVDAAHAKGLKVLLDYSMHHVSSDSQVWMSHMSDGWFNPLYRSGQECLCGSAICPWDGVPGTQCWFTDYLPDFNFTNPAARSYSVANAMSWFKDKLAPTRIDGFRLDAVKNIDISWVTAMRAALNAEETMSGQHAYLVGETYTGDQSVIKGYVDPGTMLDGQFDFPLRAALNPVILMRQGKMQSLVGFMDGNTCYYGNAIMSPFLGNQDVPRTIHFAEDAPLWSNVWADGKERGWMNQPAQPASVNPYQRMGVAMTLLMTNRGAPLLYYGDEIGFAGAGDPDNRRMMQWDASKYNAGQKGLLATVKALGAIRAAHTALRHGDRTTLSVTDDTWVYRMEDDPDVVYVAINRSDTAQPAASLPGMMLKELLTGTMVNGSAATIPARGALILTQ